MRHAPPSGLTISCFPRDVEQSISKFSRSNVLNKTEYQKLFHKNITINSFSHLATLY
jgi:hypothetical protein